MSKKVIAFLYNVRHTYPDPNNPQSQLETDYDDPATIKTIQEHIANLGYEVLPIEADEYAYAKLKRNKDRIHLAYNYSLGLYGYDRYGQLPAMMEMLQIPYTGARPLAQSLVQDKEMMKDILIANNIPTLPYQVFHHVNERIRRKLKFPLIVKPVAQGSSAGITNDSVVYTEMRLWEQVEYIMDLFGDGALVEPFIRGREFSVSMLGNPPQFLPIIEADHSTLPEGYEPLDSLEVKWILEEESGGESDHLICPAYLSEKLRRKVERVCLGCWRCLEMIDYCRIDVRLDDTGQPFVLDVNSPPGFIPPEVSMTSYFPLAARADGLSYEHLLKKLFTAALERYK